MYTYISVSEKYSYIASYTNIPISFKPMNVFICILAIARFIFLNIIIAYLGKNKLFQQMVVIIS